jgi:hypothetical protein
MAESVNNLQGQPEIHDHCGRMRAHRARKWYKPLRAIERQPVIKHQGFTNDPEVPNDVPDGTYINLDVLKGNL